MASNDSELTVDARRASCSDSPLTLRINDTAAATTLEAAWPGA
jgi:hypothetical protein